MRLLYRERHQLPVSGSESFIGKPAEAVFDFKTEGEVWFEGERWKAVSLVPVNRGDQLRVIGRRGLILEVESWDQQA
ncbi:NfeD family protein [Dongshaea marina]